MEYYIGAKLKCRFTGLILTVVSCPRPGIRIVTAATPFEFPISVDVLQSRYVLVTPLRPKRNLPEWF